MSEKILVKDLQKQDPGSALVHLYEIEYTKGTYAYFFDGLDSNLSSVTMLDYSNNSQTNTYTAMPINLEGAEKHAATKMPQPTITIANITAVFKNAVGSVDYRDMNGLKVVKRTTLRKYLKSEGDTNNPPIEYPREVFLIDSLKARTKASLTFQLQAPFDLQGIVLPRRSIIPNRCPWIYQGASEHTENAEFRRERSGCNWNIESKYSPFYTTTLANDSTVYTVYINEDDEYLVPTGTSFSAYSSGAVTQGTYYSTTTAGVKRFNADGTSSSVTVTNYWQAAKSVSSPGTPSDTNSNFNRVRLYSSYSHGTEYFTYEDDKYNDYVTFQDNTAAVGAETYQKTLLWKATKPSQNTAPTYSIFWERGDACSKTLKGCGMRFGFNPKNVGTASSTANSNFSTQVVLPFGGFPGAKNFS